MNREENKLNRYDEIIKIAKSAFISSGLEKSNMTEIADRANISRRTLYRYFDSKEILAFEVELRIFDDFSKMIKNFTASLTGNGYLKLEQLLKHLTVFISEYKNEIRFTGEFDHYFSGDYPDKSFSEKLGSRIIQINESILNIAKEGTEDKSIRNDIDLDLTYGTCANAFFSLIQRLVIRGHHIKEEQGFDPDQMIEQFSKVILNSIKAV